MRACKWRASGCTVCQGVSDVPVMHACMWCTVVIVLLARARSCTPPWRHAEIKEACCHTRVLSASWNARKGFRITTCHLMCLGASSEPDRLALDSSTCVTARRVNGAPRILARQKSAWHFAVGFPDCLALVTSTAASPVVCSRSTLDLLTRATS